MIKLKGVYKYPDWNDIYGFQQWLARTNPGVEVKNGSVFKLSVAIKERKKRRLKKMVLKIYTITCDCCGPATEMVFDKPTYRYTSPLQNL